MTQFEILPINHVGFSVCFNLETHMVCSKELQKPIKGSFLTCSVCSSEAGTVTQNVKWDLCEKKVQQIQQVERGTSDILHLEAWH